MTMRVETSEIEDEKRMRANLTRPILCEESKLGSPNKEDRGVMEESVREDISG